MPARRATTTGSTLTSACSSSSSAACRRPTSIRTATINAARLLRREGELGVLREGAYADVIALDGNPLDDITELTRVGAVVAAGEVVRNDW